MVTDLMGSWLGTSHATDPSQLRDEQSVARPPEHRIHALPGPPRILPIFACETLDDELY